MEINNLTFAFEKKKNLFQDLSLDIQNGQTTVFLGPSGCGKSTLLRIFAGLQRLKSNQCLYQHERASFVFQDSNLLDWLTSIENIMLPSKLSQQAYNPQVLSRTIEFLKISACLRQFPHELSGGQKMRVSIARALVSEPKILFMDEPFSSLDEPSRFQLQDELKSIQKILGMTILFVTHSYFEAVYLGERIIMFSDEKPTAIIHDEQIENLFDSRFDPRYLEKVKKLSNFLGGGKSLNEVL